MITMFIGSKNKNKKKSKVVMIKLDLHKAYDSVRWVAMDQVLKKIGFGRLSRWWI